MKRPDTTYIKKCKSCNSNEFIIVEKIFHEAELSETEIDLTTYGVINHRITKIFCKKCKTKYNVSDFKLINF